MENQPRHYCRLAGITLIELLIAFVLLAAASVIFLTWQWKAVKLRNAAIHAVRATIEQSNQDEQR